MPYLKARFYSVDTFIYRDNVPNGTRQIKKVARATYENYKTQCCTQQHIRKFTNPAIDPFR